MTDRERWIVYPLLFLALGASLRDKLFDTTMSRRIVCQELVVVDEGKYPDGPAALVRIGPAQTQRGNSRIGHIEVNGRIDAEQYFAGGVPLTSPRRAVIPGISFRDLYRAWQQAARQQQEVATPPSPSPERDNGDQSPQGPALDDASDALPTTPLPNATDELAPETVKPSPASPTAPADDAPSDDATSETE